MANFIQRLFGSGRRKQRGIPVNGVGFDFFGGQLVPYTDDKKVYIDKGFKHNDTIYAVTTLITDTAKIAPWAAYKVVDERAYKMYSDELRKEQPNWKKVKQHRAKALELYTGDARLQQLLKYPNNTQTWSQLNEELWLYKLITGEYFEFWDNAPTGGLNKGVPLSLSALPSQYMLIEANRTLPLAPEKYFMQVGQFVEFTKEQVLQEKYPNLEWDVYGSQLRGQAPLQASLRRLQRNNTAMDSSTAAQQHGGMRGVAYPDDPRLDPNDDKTFEQMGVNKKSFQNEMKPGPTGSGRVWWSQWKLGYQQMGFNQKDLQALESEELDLRFFCNTWKVPSQLLNDSASKTFNTVQEAEKALICRCVIPLLNDRRDSLNRKMARTDNVIVDFDLSVYDQLQPNKTQIADWVNKMPLTNARKLEIIGEDVPETMTEEERNMILIPSGFIPLSDVTIPTQDVSAAAQQLDEEGANPYNL